MMLGYWWPIHFTDSSRNRSSVNTYIVEEIVVCRKQLGGKLGSSLQSDLGVSTVGDLLQFSEEKLQERYGSNTG